MKIRFIEWAYPEEYDFQKIVEGAGLAHDIDWEDVRDTVWDGGTRELELHLELDTETGSISVVSS